jgi:ComEC/Rec2-related protein
MARQSRLRTRRTTLLITASISVTAGIGLSSWPAPKIYILPLIFITLLASIFHHRILLIGLVALIGVSLGSWRGEMYAPKLAEYNPHYYQKITLKVIAASDGVYDDNGQMAFEAGHIQLPDGQKLIGKIQISGFGITSVYKGDTLLVTGKLYPTLGSKQARLSYGQLQLLKRQPNHADVLRRKFAAGLQTALPEPIAPFALGILVGQRSTLPESVKQDLLMVGLTHIIAASGYNLTIILHGTRRLFVAHSKSIATFFSLSLIIVFLLMTGSSASIVRAAVVSGLAIWAAYYGRSIRPCLLIGLTAAVTAWVNPNYVWNDAGWHLSFLAFFGVLVLAPQVIRRLKIAKQDSIILLVAVESLCAEIMTLPYVLHVFNQISFVGLIANVLVVTFIPLAMLLSLFAGLAGMLAAAMAGWFAWPAKTILNYMLDVAHIFASIPNGFIENLKLSLIATAVIYAAICLLSLIWATKTQNYKNATITDKK